VKLKREASHDSRSCHEAGARIERHQNEPRRVDESRMESAVHCVVSCHTQAHTQNADDGYEDEREDCEREVESESV